MPERSTAIRCCSSLAAQMALGVALYMRIGSSAADMLTCHCPFVSSTAVAPDVEHDAVATLCSAWRGAQGRRFGATAVHWVLAGLIVGFAAVAAVGGALAIDCSGCKHARGSSWTGLFRARREPSVCRTRCAAPIVSMVGIVLGFLTVSIGIIFSA